jgi:hypothetical protein
MKQISLVIVLGASLVLLNPAAQAIGLGNLMGSKDSKTEPVDVDSFLEHAKQASNLISQSSTLLWKATASKEEIEQGEADMKSANEIKDPQERANKLLQIKSDQQTQLTAALNDKTKQDQLTKSKGEKQKNINGALYNFVLGGLKDTQLISDGSALVTNLAGNIANMSKLGKVKDVLGEVKGQIDIITKISGAISKLASSAKIDTPKSATEPAKKVDDF